MCRPTREPSEADRAAVALAQERVKAVRSRQNMTVRAPIDGNGQQPAPHTGGGVGQPVEMKVETSAFTRYGLIPGEVQSISGDGVMHEKTGQIQYPARIRLLSFAMRVDGRDVALGPGMNVTVGVKTGRRRGSGW